uniref:Serpin domain-containing protein n=1 Tax=Oryzias latipes TaxID=8090 RepID=A0A3P9H487_ORYLA
MHEYIKLKAPTDSVLSECLRQWRAEDTANISFSLAMFRQQSEDHSTTNNFFSPFSISSALAMVMLGARGDTATQMAEYNLHIRSLTMTTERRKRSLAFF